MVIENSTNSHAGSVRVGDESDIFEKGPHGFVRLKGSRTHDISNSNNHISSIAKIGSDLNEALQAVWPNRHKRYFQAHVLMLSWEDDDLRVEPELEGLQHVFNQMFNFQVQKYKIPSKKPDKELKGRMYEFLKNDSRDTLLIVYYAGHARRALQSNEASLWFPNKQNPTIAIPSGGIQSMLEEADADVLLLFDCCHSAAVPTTDSQQRSTGVMEVISACGYDEIAPEVDEHSFTKALTHTLAIASKGLPFSVGHLHSRTLSKLKCWSPALLKQGGKYVENAQGRLLYEHQPRKTPVYSIICETNPRRSIILEPMPPSPDFSKSGSEHNPPNSSDGSSGSSCLDDHDECSSRKRKRPHEDDKHSQILLAVRLTNGTINHNTWVDWLRAAPPEARDIRLEGIYGSFSTLLVLRMPVAVWNLLPENPSYSFIGFVTSGNTVWGNIPECPCTDVCDQCLKQLRAVKTLTPNQCQGQDMDVFLSGKKAQSSVQITSPADSSSSEGEPPGTPSGSTIGDYIPGIVHPSGWVENRIENAVPPPAPPLQRRRAVNSKRARKGEDDIVVDIPESTRSSLTEVEQAPSTFSSTNYDKILPSLNDAMDKNEKEESPDLVSQPGMAGEADSSPLTKDVAASLGVLNTSLVKGKGRDFVKALHRGLPPMTPEPAPDNESIAHQTRSTEHRKASTKPIPLERNEAIPLSRSLGTTLAASSGSSNILKESKVGPRKTLHRRSQSHQSTTSNSHRSMNTSSGLSSRSTSKLKRTGEHSGETSPPREHLEWFWSCCKCGHGLIAIYIESCSDYPCVHTRCTDCRCEKQKVRNAA